MLYRNNAEIDFDLLERQVAEELRTARPQPPYLFDPNNLSLKGYNESILQLLDRADQLSAARTTRPARLQRFPFKFIPFLGRLVVKLDNALFGKERLALRQVTTALRQQVQLNQQLLDQLAALARHLGKDA